MNAIVVILQLITIALCVWGELNRNLKRSSLMSASLAVIAISALIGLGKTHPEPIQAIIIWLIVAIALGAFLRRKQRQHHRTLGGH